MRRFTTGVQGGPILGSLAAQNNTLTTIETNADLTLNPKGKIAVDKAIMLNARNELRFGDADSDYYVGFKAPATVAQTDQIVWTLPTADGSANQVLQTDGSGTLTWATLTVTVTNATDADSTSYFPTMTTSTSGNISGVTTKNNRFTFQPSTGTLTTPICSHTSGTITTLASTTGNITTVNATTVNTNTLNETSSIAYKENVSPITNALDSIVKLAGVVYDRKDGSSKNEAGLIAEEVYDVIPNVVTLKDGKPEGIQYTKLTAYLIEAVKTLTDEIKELKGK